MSSEPPLPNNRNDPTRHMAAFDLAPLIRVDSIAEIVRRLLQS